MNTLPSWCHIAAPWQWQSNQSSRLARGMRVGFWVLWLMVPTTAALWWLAPQQAAVVVVLLWSMALLGWWGVQFAALLRLDHPNFARLVPTHMWRLRVTAVTWWAATAALGGSSAVAVLAWAGWPAGGLGVWHNFPFAMPAAAAALLLVALALRWPLLWLAPFLVPLSGSLPHWLRQWLWPFWQARPWLVGVLLLLVMAVALVALFGRGDSAHARAWDQRERLRRSAQASASGHTPGFAAYGRWGEWLGTPWQHLADRWLAHATRSAQPTPASVMARAEVVLYGAQHWVRQLGVLLPLLVLLLVILIVVKQWVLPQGVALMLENGHIGMGIGLICMVLGMVVGLPTALWASRREQALLMLLPGMPQGVALNRALAWRQARQGLLLWALVLLVFISVAWVGKLPQVLVMPFVLLPVMAWVWRDLAHQREPTAMTPALPFLLCLSVALGSILLLRVKPDALLLLMGGFGAAAAALLWGRWRQLSRWPQALPAGRLAVTPR
jgi:hypothetical protein